jgi:hypothetical protein
MSTADSNAVIDRVLDPLLDCFTPDVARKVVDMRADPKTQARVDELAAKANEGDLTPSEQAEYDRILELFHFVTIVQAKARKFLKLHSAA